MFFNLIPYLRKIVLEIKTEEPFTWVSVLEIKTTEG